jgi:hypothetical protein
MHISGKLAIIGAILWMVFLIIAFSMPLSLAFSDPILAAEIFLISGSIAALGFFVFVPSLVYYLWKGKDAE